MALVLTLCTAACSKTDNAPAKNAPGNPISNNKPVALTRSVTIPARVAANPSTAPADEAVLTISEGGEDELPEGPSSFDVWPDGGFVVADPLQKRLVFYDAAGEFRSEVQISFAAERVRVLPNNSLSVVRYQSGDRYIFELDSAGRYGTPRLATQQDPDLDFRDAGEATLISGNQATVGARPSPASEIPVVSVKFNVAAGENMVSVRRLGADVRQRTYVAIEAALPGPRVDVRKFIRQYSPGGDTFVELQDVPLDYLVHPVDEFRIGDGVVYQLMPKASEVRINIWDTNSRP